jgi:hypothetical protein
MWAFRFAQDLLAGQLHLGAERLQRLGLSGYCRFVDQVFLQQLMVETVQGELQAVGDAELVVDLAQVVLDDLFGGADLISDFLVAHAAGDATDDGQLLLRELGLDLGIGEIGGLGAVGLDDPTDGLIVDPGLAFGDLADTLDKEVGGDGARDNATDAAAVELDGVGFVGFADLDDQLGFGRLAYKFRDGVDGAGDELAFEDDDVGGVALQGGIEVGEGLDLGDDSNVVFEGKDLLHAHAIDGLRVGKDDTDADVSCIFFWSVFATAGWIKVHYSHIDQAFKKYSSITAAAFFWPPCR